MLIRDLAKGIGYAVYYGLKGMVFGVAASVTYIAARVSLNIPNSIPSAEVDVNVSEVERCLQNGAKKCDLQIVTENLEYWTVPIFVTSVAATGLGMVAGAAKYIHDRRRQNYVEISTPDSEGGCFRRKHSLNA